MSRAIRPTGHRFINGQAAEGNSEEEYDQDDDNPLKKLLFLHFDPLPSPYASEQMSPYMGENGENTVFCQGGLLIFSNFKNTLAILLDLYQTSFVRQNDSLLSSHHY